MKKYTMEFIKEEFAKKGYEVLSEEYIDSHTPLIVKKNDYIAKLSYGNLKSCKNATYFGFNNEYAEKNIETYVRKKFKEKTEILSIKRITKSKRNRFLLELRCERCGCVYNQLFDDITKKNKKHLLCSKCNKIDSGIRHRKSEIELLDAFEKEGYEIFPNQKLIRNNNLKVKDKDGYIGYISYGGIKRGRKMSPFEMRGNYENYIYNINNWCKNNGIGTRAIKFSEEQIHYNTDIDFVCECGNYFKTTKGIFVNGKCFCDECSKKISSYEKKVKEYLDEKEIDYIYQFKINECKDVLPLPFDFQLKEYNVLIEVDGEGHEEPRRFNNMNYEKAIKTYNETIKHDKMKNEYCKKYNIPLLRINYRDIKNSDNYKSIIDNFINNL